MSGNKEGWLRKDKKRRYFVLSGTNLTWLLQPLGKVLGTIDLRNYIVSKKDDGELGIMIKPLDRHKEAKTYFLYPKDLQEYNEWLVALKVSKNSISPTPPPPQSLQNNGGWLEKKGKKRWFILRENVLYWYTKEQSITSEFSKNVEYNGSLDLRVGVTVTELLNAPKKHSFSLTTQSGLSYVLTAYSEEDKKSWLASLRESVAENQKLRDKSMLKSGWLIKKSKRRFFVLQRDVLSWYLTEKDGMSGTNKKGELILSKCDMMNNSHLSGKSTFLICTAVGSKYELQAKSAQELKDWCDAVLLAKEPSAPSPSIDNPHTFSSAQSTAGVKEAPTKMQGWLVKKGKKRYFVLLDDVLMWFSDVPSAPSATPSQAMPAAAMATAKVIDHIKDVKIQLNLKEFKESKEVKALFKQSSNEPNGSITLANCTIISRPDQFTFGIFTSTNKSYFLTAKSVQEMYKWTDTLRRCIASATLHHNNNNTSSSSSSGASNSPRVKQKSGWLMKKGKPRYFMVINDTLMWFEKEQTVDLSKGAKGSITLAGCSTQMGNNLMGSKSSLSLSSESGRTYILTAKSAEEAEEWHSFLRDCIAAANETKHLHANYLTAEGCKSGWLLKKGGGMEQKRWFVLRNRILMWYLTEQQGSDSSATVKGSISLAHCKLTHNHDFTFSLETSLGVKYRLTATSTAEMHDWMKAIQAAITEANQESDRHYIIAETHYSKLLEILLARDLMVPLSLMKVYQSDEVVSTFVRLFYTKDEHIRLLNHIVYRELSAAANNDPTTLFREDSNATKAARAFFKLVASEYLKKTIGPLINNITAHPNESYEVDTSKGVSASESVLNLEKLRALAATFLDTILRSFQDFPPSIRVFLHNVKRMVAQCFPEHAVKAIGGFVFLRFVCPAIFTPEGFGLLQDSPPETPRRTLILVAKVLQNVCNGVPFNKEPYMVGLNNFVITNKDKLSNSLDRLSEPPAVDLLKQFPKVEIPQRNKLKDLALIVRYLDVNFFNLEKELEQGKEIDPTSRQKGKENLKMLKQILAEI